VLCAARLQIGPRAIHRWNQIKQLTNVPKAIDELDIRLMRASSAVATSKESRVNCANSSELCDNGQVSTDTLMVEALKPRWGAAAAAGVGGHI
jgi:hypothetical protein